MLTRTHEAALIALAASARGRAYAPYSNYSVGAAVVADDERTFHGCNIENASLGLTLCAERAAAASAVAAGVRRIVAVVVVAGGSEPVMPCGACLQWLAEFCDPTAAVVAATASGRIRRSALRDLIKEPFRL
jgi:cytidine deaminase